MSMISVGLDRRGILPFLAAIFILTLVSGCETDEARKREKVEEDKRVRQFLADLSAPDSAAVTLLSLKHSLPEEVTQSVLVAYKTKRLSSLMGGLERDSITSLPLRDLIGELAQNHEVEPRVVAELIYDYYFVRKETLW